MRGILRSILIAVLVATSIAPAVADRGRGRGGDGAVFTRVQDDDDRGRRGRGRGDRDHDRARDGVRSARLVPLEAILANIARIYPGYHIDVDGPYPAGGRLVYRIKWLTPDGRVIIIIADAETGQILSQRGGR
jgi:uncharacterized membrane protein YkoI